MVGDADEEYRYRCTNCGRAIATEGVVRIDLERRWALESEGAKRRRTGFVLIVHHCACSSRLLTSRRYASFPGFVALFGRGVRLPYVSPFAVIDLRDDDPRLRRWRFEIEQVAGVDDLLLWIDAERRKARDELRQLGRPRPDGP